MKSLEYLEENPAAAHCAGESETAAPRFDQLGLAEILVGTVTGEGYLHPTPIQAEAIPAVLQGSDLLGCAQTGTGKTAAFSLPMIHRMISSPAARRGRIRGLILAPTRELAAQIQDSLRRYCRLLPLRSTTVHGGVSPNPQIKALRRGVEIVVATPGRLLDLMNQGFVDLRFLEVLVLDEADRMLDMGFIPDVRRIVAETPETRQTLMFSATMPVEIRKLADSILRSPLVVKVSEESIPTDRIDQTVHFVPRHGKSDLLAQLLQNEEVSRALVFTRTRHGADRLVEQLIRMGIRCDAVHGSKSQAARTRAIENFRRRSGGVLVATDLAARGLDIDDVSHVFNYDLPEEPETYMHRIGRTARAGASGSAVSLVDTAERKLLFDIQKLLGSPIEVMVDGERTPGVEPVKVPHGKRPVYRTPSRRPKSRFR